MASTNTSRGTLLVVDGHSLAFRAFFALPVENFSTSQGQATNAVWGFASMLSQVIEAEKPNKLAVAFDVKGGTFRSDMLPQYKGTRDAAPEELLTQLPLIQRMLDAFGVQYIEKPGYEGDDVIATLATMGQREGFHTLVLSGDRDAFQLVNDDITVLYPGHHFKDLKHMTPEEIVAKYKVTPEQYPDLAALRGETADNIPGIPGVGDGFAAKWINQFGSLQGIVEHADEITGKKGEALRDNIDQVLLNRKVNALVRDLDLPVTINNLDFGHVAGDDWLKLCKELEFGVRTRSKMQKTFQLDNSTLTDIKTEAKEEFALIPCQWVSRGQEILQWSKRELTVFENSDTFAVQSDETAELNKVVSAQLVQAVSQQEIQQRAEQSWVLHCIGTVSTSNPRVQCVALSSRKQTLLIDAVDIPKVLNEIQQVLDAYGESLVVHGFKEQLHMTSSIGLTLPDPLFDTKLACYIAEPDYHGDTLVDYSEHFLQIHLEQSEVASQGELDLEGLDEPQDTALQQAQQYATIIHALTQHTLPILCNRDQIKLLHSIELPISRVLFAMEHTGAAVDRQRLTDMRDMFSAEANQAQEVAWHEAGTQVNLQSPKQLSHILFEQMGLKPKKRTKSGSYTTSAAVLQDLYLHSLNNESAHEFLGALLRHRETNKLKQIVQTLIDAIAEDGRIHTTFEQTVAATGRLSSTDPNLQNIPNRAAQGREIRSVFVPSEGYVSLLSADYSQVELRIMAHLSQDEALIEAFQSGTDFHRYVASLVYGVSPDEISSDQRSHVKAMSYGLAYGLSTYGLAQQLGISPAAADVLKDKYFATFGKVHDYLESLVSQARARGYTETMFGRRRYFPALKSTNRTAREAAERGALNAPIQGSAADIMKIAMIRADEALHKAHAKSRILLQIHDELVVELAAGEQEMVTQLVSDAMEHAVQLRVPLDVSTGIGSDWQLAQH